MNDTSHREALFRAYMEKNQSLAIGRIWMNESDFRRLFDTIWDSAYQSGIQSQTKNEPPGDDFDKAYYDRIKGRE